VVRILFERETKKIIDKKATYKNLGEKAQRECDKKKSI
jgi:hypothetical protein